MDVHDVLAKLTLEEKVYLLQAKDGWSLNGVDRLGIPNVSLTDGPSGVRLAINEKMDTLPATALPTESCLSASWDETLVEELGHLMAEECQEYGVGVLLGPGVNAKRSPLAGRNFEYYSEDPFLSGKLAAAMIRGVQSLGVGTSLKHYVANDQETRRFTSDASVDERTLRELLLTPFEIAIKEAKPWTIMGAYPKLRGTQLCENAYVLKDILRDEYGYQGVVLTDWGACVHKVTAHKNGLDLETGSWERAQEMLDAVKTGKITEAEIDEHVLRVLELIDKVQSGRKGIKVDWERHHKVAQKSAAESIVLLKNEDKTLPLNPGCKVAVIGSFAAEPRYTGGGSSGVIPKQLDVPLDCISRYADAEYAAGYNSEEPNVQLIEEACETAKGKDFVIVFVGTTPAMESEGADRKNLSLPKSHLALLQELHKVNKSIVVCNFSGAAVELAPVESKAKAILHAGLFGEGGGAALADILFGKGNPSGKLTETFPIRLEHTPAFPYFPGTGDAISYHEGLLQGYRWYDTRKLPVQYPFGHGLSYTEFAYDNLRFSKEVLHNGETLTLSVDVTNFGAVAGAEVVQIYVSDVESMLVRPEKELKGFARVELEPGETKTVTIHLDERAFAYFVPHVGRYCVETGEFKILVAASSADIRLEGTIFFQSEDELREPLTMENTMEEYWNDNRYTETVRQVYAAIHVPEDSPMFPILSSMRLKVLPGVLKYIQIPEEQSIQYQQMILNAASKNQD